MAAVSLEKEPHRRPAADPSPVLAPVERTVKVPGTGSYPPWASCSEETFPLLLNDPRPGDRRLVRYPVNLSRSTAWLSEVRNGGWTRSIA